MWEAVRKFGLEYCDFPTMLSNVSDMLRVLLLTVDGRNKKPIPKLFYFVTVICTISYFYVYVFSAFWLTFWRCNETGDLGTAMVSLSLSITSEVVVMKVFYMMFYQDKIINLTQRYLQCDALTVEGSRFSMNMTKSLRTVKMRAICYWVSLMTNAFLYVLKPIVTPGRHLTLDGFVIFGLEPMFQSPNYEIASSTTAIDVFYVCYSVANVSGFLILIIGYTEAQMLSLSKEMIHIWPDAKEHYKKTIKELNRFEAVYLKKKVINVVTEREIVNEYVTKHLIDIIGRHAVNVSLLAEVENVMRGPNAVGFLFHIIGLIAELLGGLENTILQLPFTLIQLGVDCYLGQKIMDASTEFERAVYACNWENFSEYNKKIVMVMLQNAQKTMTLTAGGMVTLSFSYFMFIIRSTYSAYNTLGSMIKKEK